MRGFNDRDIKCPFFRNHNEISICCESPIPDASDRHTFCGRNAKKKKEMHCRIFCCAKFENCESYIAIMRKYDDLD